ncbi:nucleotidyltransferase [Lactococcus nasutitermitis]|uniref:tRNA(Met) cytidine acetate ligase n=1 Tax=Lactococcus nasutitermitis TaxID=1652957 RepID=A0ABV9JEZ4_9LACT|nr:nucleotidyltransferase [Lactococcus nasutitermitis]
MSEITGIIAEFNPFHNGHKRLLDVASGLKIVAMSGNWMQRGEPAIFDKWTRAEMALKNGADLVVELPVTVSVQSADFFAQGAVAILSELGIDTLLFGSESTTDYNKIAELYAARKQDMDDFVKNLPDNVSYPEKTQQMWQHFSSVKFDGNMPNHVLALAYAKASFDKSVKLQTLQRIGDFHSAELTGQFASATALRQFLTSRSNEPKTFLTELSKIKKVIPSNLTDLYKSPQASWHQLFPLLQYKIISSDLTNIFQVNEELQNRLKIAIKTATTFDELLEQVHTKRYTKARVRRLLTYILLNISRDFTLPEKIHVLGFTKKGQAHLKKFSEKTIVRIGQTAWDSTTQRADTIYRLANPQIPEQNYGRKPIIF